MATTDEISAFWALFRERAAALTAPAMADRTFAELLQSLQRINPGLFLEYCADADEGAGACQLIVTAEGEKTLFPLAREVVALAPAIPGWTVRALKPRLGLPATVTWRDVTLDPEALSFEPLDREGGLHLRVFVPGLRAENAEHTHNAVLRALEHVVGEERFAALVGHTEVRPLPAGATTRGLPLEDLDDYLAGRERQGGPGASG